MKPPSTATALVKSIARIMRSKGLLRILAMMARINTTGISKAASAPDINNGSNIIVSSCFNRPKHTITTWMAAIIFVTLSIIVILSR